MTTILQTQKVINTASAATVTTTFGSTPTPGDLLVACVMGANTSVPAITGGLWSPAVGGVIVNTAQYLAIMFKIAGASEPTAVVATAASAAHMNLALLEYSNSDGWPAGAGALDVTAMGINSGTAVTSFASGTTAATAQAAELAIVVLREGTGGDTITWSNSFDATQLGSDRIYVTDKILSSIGAVSTTASWTNATGAGACLAVFKGVAVKQPAMLAVL